MIGERRRECTETSLNKAMILELTPSLTLPGDMGVNKSIMGPPLLCGVSLTLLLDFFFGVTSSVFTRFEGGGVPAASCSRLTSMSLAAEFREVRLFSFSWPGPPIFCTGIQMTMWNGCESG